MTRARANLLLLACAAVWGLAFVCQKRAMMHLGPFLFIVLRSLLACAALAKNLSMSLWEGRVCFNGSGLGILGTSAGSPLCFMDHCS